MSDPAVCTLCKAPAQYAYTWDWGESGFCCARCSVALNHRSQAVGRVCRLTALTPGAPKPVEYDERINMHAKVLAAEDEVVAVKARNLQLFEANQKLIGEQQRMATEASELRTQLADARAEADQLTVEKMDALKRLADVEHERARLQGILEAARTQPA